MNTICVYGRLASDVTVNTMSNGRNVANFRVASRTRRKSNGGDNDYITNFYSVSAWGALADQASKYLKKGNRVAVSGEFVIRSYKGNDGLDHFAHEIDASGIDLVETKSESGNTTAEPAATARTAPAGFTPVETDDELPF